MGFHALDGKDSEAIDDLTIEDNGERLSIYGSLNITLDKVGLEKAIKLKNILNEATNHMLHQSALGKLPDELPPQDTEEVNNPFN